MIELWGLQISWPLALLVAVALLGHLSLYIALKNSLHARAIPHRVLKQIDWVLRAHLVGIPVLIALWSRNAASTDQAQATVPLGLAFYVLVCVLVAIGPLPWSLAQRFRRRQSPAIRSYSAQVLDLGPQLTEMLDQKPIGRFMCALPGNEAFRVEVARLELEVPRLPAALDGLVIAQITDFHMTGRLGRKFYELALDAVDAMRPDLIALTGDLVDKPHCLDWIDATFGKLSAPYGVYYILGNHDARVDVTDLRRRLASAGLLDVGGMCRTLEIHGETLVLVGNELPWFGPAGDLTKCPAIAEARAAGQPEPFKLLLSHSPDQIDWARQRDIDLMLSGHTHGGQIRFPVLEATVCPSLFGVKYASGTFWEPPTLLHVNRGLGAEWPIRWRCMPEITRITLRAPAAVAASESATDEVALRATV